MPYGITQCYLRWESRLYPQPKHVLDLATPEGFKAELTYVTWKPTGGELNPRPVNHKSNALPLSHHATLEGNAESKILLQQNPLFLNWGCRLIEFDMCNGCEVVVCLLFVDHWWLGVACVEHTMKQCIFTSLLKSIFFLERSSYSCIVVVTSWHNC